MTRLIITRGLPASGKTTYAKRWVNLDPDNHVRVNRDDLRQMAALPYSQTVEQRIIKQRDMLIDEFLCRGLDVINDDTNLPSRTVRDLANIAKRVGAEFGVVDFTDVDIDTCLTRNRDRIANGERGVPDEVIQTMWMKYINGKQHPLPVPELKELPEASYTVYTPDMGRPQAFIFDIDGTVAHMNGRSPYDYTRVSEDLPDEHVIDMAKQLHNRGAEIIFLSGRKDSCWDDTHDWLVRHIGFSDFTLLMRKSDDNRRDSIVKYELFDKYVRDAWWIMGVFDDRDQCVKLWRDLGLKCYQVAHGNF